MLVLNDDVVGDFIKHVLAMEWCFGAVGMSLLRGIWHAWAFQ